MAPSIRKLLSVAALAVVLTHTTLCSSPTAQGQRTAQLGYNTRSKMQRLLTQSQTNDSSSTIHLQDQLDAYIREGRFPKAGRSLEQKIREANTFLNRELGNLTATGIGASVAIVYKDQVMLSKGYGLRQSNDNSSHVTPSTLFQIGSMTKTFIALGIAALVDDGNVTWHDPVIQHLPTLELFDKYAEKYVTIGDLLSMNSGLGRVLDVPWLAFGMYPTDKDLVSALRNVDPPHSLRSEYDYANANFAILGQLIESVTGLEWDAFLQQRIWEPLNMTRTFTSAFAAKDDKDMSSGHVACRGEVLGPFDLVTSPEAQLVTGEAGAKMAAGSIVSSSDDMAKLLRLLLNKGRVDGVEVLKTPQLVTDMASGKTPVNAEFADYFSKSGHQFAPEGNTLASGYGFDFVTHGSWGHAYFEKAGDTILHHTRTGFAPDEQLGVVVMVNAKLPGDGFLEDHVLSYVMGIFLDVPMDILEYSFATWREADQPEPLLPGAPVCGLSFWKNPQVLSLGPKEEAALAGVYVAQGSPEFYGSVAITQTTGSNTGLQMRGGKLSGKLSFVADLGGDQGKAFLWSAEPFSTLVAISTNASGKYGIAGFGITFSQQ